MLFLPENPLTRLSRPPAELALLSRLGFDLHEYFNQMEFALSEDTFC